MEGSETGPPAGDGGEKCEGLPTVAMSAELAALLKQQSRRARYEKERVKEMHIREKYSELCAVLAEQRKVGHLLGRDPEFLDVTVIWTPGRLAGTVPVGVLAHS